MNNKFSGDPSEYLEGDLILKKDVLSVILSYYPDFDPSKIEIKEISFDNQIILFFYSGEKYACSIYHYKDYVKFVDDIRNKICKIIKK